MPVSEGPGTGANHTLTATNRELNVHEDLRSESRDGMVAALRVWSDCASGRGRAAGRP